MWAEYFRQTKLYEVNVLHGEDTYKAYNAIWRSGPDRLPARASNKVLESSNSSLDEGLEKVAKALSQQVMPGNALP